jgi:uncharacterized Zn finger protein
MLRDSHDQYVGRCPDCGYSLDRSSVVVRYETDGGWLSTVAECDSCGPVHPE